MRRKAQAWADFAVYGVLILFSVVFLVGVGLLTLTFSDAFSGNSDLTSLTDAATAMPTGFDITIITIIIGLGVIIFLTSYLFNNSPIFFGLFLLLILIMLLVSIPMVNGIYDMLQQDSVAAVKAKMPATNFFISNWIWVLLFYVTVSIVGFAAKGRVEDFGGLGI